MLLSKRWLLIVFLLFVGILPREASAVVVKIPVTTDYLQQHADKIRVHSVAREEGIEFAISHVLVKDHNFSGSLSVGKGQAKVCEIPVRGFQSETHVRYTFQVSPNHLTDSQFVLMETWVADVRGKPGPPAGVRYAFDLSQHFTKDKQADASDTENGAEPKFVIDDRPESGVPREALDQARAESNLKDADLKEYHGKLAGREKELLHKNPITFHEITEGTIKKVRIRYFNKETWETEEEALEYVRGFLAHKSLHGFNHQIWSQGVGVPEIECLVDFTDKHRRQLREEQKRYREGRLLIWKTESCFRSASGRWWYVSAYDHFHRSHPEGNRKLAKQTR